MIQVTGLPNVFESNNPFVRRWLTEMRDTATKPPRFRELATKISRELIMHTMRRVTIRDRVVYSPNGPANGIEIPTRIAFVPIVRAGEGMLPAAMEIVEDASVWHVGLFRDEHTLRPVEYQNKIPQNGAELTDMAVILDPMLATGRSASHTAKLLRAAGVTNICYVGLFGVKEGIAELHSVDDQIMISLAVIDPILLENGFISPGVGDAGDRLFGT